MDRKKELKQAYKLNPPAMGVFQLKNTGNGKILVGGSMNLSGKKNSLLFQLKMGGHPSKRLQADWNAAGAEAFTFDILETIKPADLAPDEWRKAVAVLADKWSDRLQPYGDNGYNEPKKTKTTAS